MEQIDGRRGVTIEGDARGKFRAVLESFKAAIPESERKYIRPARSWSVSPAASPQLEGWAAECARKFGARIERRDLSDVEQLIEQARKSLGSG